MENEIITTALKTRLMNDIEKYFDGKIITYVSYETMNYLDIVDFYEKLKALNSVEHLILFLFTPGGDIDAAYKLISLCRQQCSTLTVIVPFLAKSAGTLVALGADTICMGKISELGPIDPQIFNSRLELAGPCQAIRDCIDYIREQVAKDKTMQIVMYPVMDKLDPWLIGNFERNTKIARQYAEKLLKNGVLKDKPNDFIQDIIDKLTEGYFSHGYVIDRVEAREELGLNVVDLDGDIWDAVWTLYRIYHLERTEDDALFIETEESLRTGVNMDDYEEANKHLDELLSEENNHSENPCTINEDGIEENENDIEQA